MQASLVTALVPITTAVPVTLLVLHQPESDTEPSSAETVPPQRITTHHTTAKKVSQTIPRSVTVKAKSLLKRAKSVPNLRTSLLRPVNTSNDKKSLLKPSCKTLDESYLKQVMWPKRNTSLLKPVKTNSEPSNTKSLSFSTNQSVSDKAQCASGRNLVNSVIRSKSNVLLQNQSATHKSKEALGRNPVNSVIRSKNNVSLLKPVIASQGRDFDKTKRETLKEEPQIVKSLNGEIIDNLPRHVVKTVRPAKSLLKLDTLQNKHPNNTLGANREDHAYSLNHRQCLPARSRADTKRKSISGDITDKELKTRPRAQQSVASIKKKLEKSKEKLHSRHRMMNSTIGKITDLKNLLLDLKSRKLVTEEGHSRLVKAVDRTITVLKNNFTADPTV